MELLHESPLVEMNTMLRKETIPFLRISLALIVGPVLMQQVAVLNGHEASVICLCTVVVVNRETVVLQSIIINPSV